ncbi:MAG: NAD(P)/FAD-dependent oxidoreductase [Candidatus Krumholzibacteriota bacterium]|nr:NAD(P)/FAD-dependent oxidoreductase [Candidatus Krumholzibacteriota bacterium]
MKYDYDLICIGLGPAGMAVSLMAVEMGLTVCAVEKDRLGGECMNVGCIPSKSLLRMAKAAHTVRRLERMELGPLPAPVPRRPFERIRGYCDFIGEKKTRGMFEKVDLLLGEGAARFVDPHTVAVGERRLTARRIFIATGTEPMVPPIPGIEGVDPITNTTLFDLDAVPASLLVLGGGAIGCEMAQAFARLGSKVTVVHMDPHLIPAGEADAGELLERVFASEGIAVHNGRRLVKAERAGAGVVLHTDRGERLEGERLLVAAGRRIPTGELDLEKAGVALTARGAIHVDRYLRTTQKHIYAVGDVNGHFLLSHAAMHQGMIALMNSMLPWPMKRDFRRYVVPWTVFTDPPASHVGELARQLDARGAKYETIEVGYGDYGAAIAEDCATGWLKVYASRGGRIFGVRIVGEGSGEMINEWALAIQNRVPLHKVMMVQHSFPTMGFLSKRAAETWMTRRLASPWLRRACRLFYRR